MSTLDLEISWDFGHSNMDEHEYAMLETEAPPAYIPPPCSSKPSLDVVALAHGMNLSVTDPAETDTLPSASGENERYGRIP